MTTITSTTLAVEPLEAVEAATGAVPVYGWLIPLLPLAGFVILIFAGRWLRSTKVPGVLASATVAGSFLASCLVVAQLLTASDDARALLVPGFTWIGIGDLQITTDLLLDPLSATMLMVITGVGALVHVYSIGYMHGDPRETRYFAYLNLFIFSMLLLVLASNFVVLFVGWELVGLCSYLLIGFWFEQRPNATAAKKAFVVNRVGDVSFAIGLFLIFATFGSFAMPEVIPAAADVLGDNPAVATAIGLLLLGGAVGKSAQIPLYVWLPDAMAGPTPVSALIHAATMVTAGVYMIARASTIYLAAPGAMEVVAIIGIATALLAALIAIQQDDIKMVLAYSTVSQLGYMFVGIGVGAFSAGIFHLVTHAFFKGLLFLAAGSVMHAMANRTDMWGMGGLRKDMPVTFWTSLVAVAAISGVPPFSGFFSKDHILTAAYNEGHLIIWVLGLLTATLTAFYMTRWLIVPFFGAPRWKDAGAQRHAGEDHAGAGGLAPADEDIHPHESPPSMTVPLIVLAVLSAGAGLLNPTHGGPLDRWLEPAVAHAEEGHGALPEWALIVIAIAFVAVGVLAAVAVYRGAPRHDPLTARLGGVGTAMRRKFWVDEAYSTVFFRGGGAAARGMAWFDRTVIDGAVNGIGRATQRTGTMSRRLQTGYVRIYVAGFVVGTVVVIAAFLVQVVA